MRFLPLNVQPIFQLFLKRTLRGAQRECNYGAMIQSQIIRIVERIPTIKDLIKRLINNPLFRLDCGFLVSDVVPSEASYTRMIDVISQSDVLDVMQDTLIWNGNTFGHFLKVPLKHKGRTGCLTWSLYRHDSLRQESS
ncbi:transposase [Lysinibacillus mangiferihumi]